MYFEIWRRDALNQLQDHNARKAALKNIPAKIAELEAAFCAIRSAVSDGTPVSGGGSGREDALLNNIVCRQQLEKSLTETGAAVERVEQALSVLTADDRRILDYCYISPRKGAVSKLAGELLVDEKTVYNRRNNALRLFTKALYGEVGNPLG